MSFNLKSRLWILFVSAGLAAGCGSTSSESDSDNVKRQTQARVEAMKQLALAIEKKDAVGIEGAVEGLVSNALDVKANPEAAKELVEVYKTKVKDKLKGEQAIQVKGIVAAIEAEMGK